jgi:hypothetical protein
VTHNPLWQGRQGTWSLEAFRGDRSVLLGQAQGLAEWLKW